MYVRVSHGTFDPTKRSEAVAISRESADVLAGLPGFVRFVGGLDDASGTLVAITLWDSEDAARFDRSVLGDILGRMSASGLALQAPRVFQVDVDQSAS